MKFLLAFSILLVVYNPANASSCAVTERKAWCRDLSTNPATEKLIDINGCSVSCNPGEGAHCLPGYLYSDTCNEGLEPSRCFCN